MANLIDLKKKVGIVLAKRNVSENIMAQVGVAFDITGSMQNLYMNGTVQSLAERLLAVALRFDDNGNLDAWSFCHGSDELPGVTEQNYANYVKKELIDGNIDKWGGTSFAPVLEGIEKFYFGGTSSKSVRTEKSAGGIMGLFGKKKVEIVQETVTTAGENDGSMPVYLMFITDGDNFDQNAAADIVRKMKDENVYLEFIGVGTDATFSFCQKMAKDYGNVGFVHIKDINKITDEQLYETLLNEEFCEWIKK